MPLVQELSEGPVWALWCQLGAVAALELWPQGAKAQSLVLRAMQLVSSAVRLLLLRGNRGGSCGQVPSWEHPAGESQTPGLGQVQSDTSHPSYRPLPLQSEWLQGLVWDTAPCMASLPPTRVCIHTPASPPSQAHTTTLHFLAHTHTHTQ